MANRQPHSEKEQTSKEALLSSVYGYIATQEARIKDLETLLREARAQNAALAEDIRKLTAEAEKTNELARKLKVELSRARKEVVMQFCQYILKQLLSHEDAWPFTKPVDATALKLDDYHDVIKFPMDLGTIKRKLDNNQYRSPEDFADDFRLMIDNCRTYNHPDTEVVAMANELQGLFERLFSEMPIPISISPHLEAPLNHANHASQRVSTVKTADKAIFVMVRPSTSTVPPKADSELSDDSHVSANCGQSQTVGNSAISHDSIPLVAAEDIPSSSLRIVKEESGQRRISTSIHSGRVDNGRVLKTNSVVRKRQDPTRCSYCTFASADHLEVKEHVRTEHQIKCTKCWMAFGSREERQEHILTSHSDNGFYCEECNMIFRQRDFLNDHLGTLKHTAMESLHLRVLAEIVNTFNLPIVLPPQIMGTPFRGDHASIWQCAALKIIRDSDTVSLERDDDDTSDQAKASAEVQVAQDPNMQENDCILAVVKDEPSDYDDSADTGTAVGAKKAAEMAIRPWFVSRKAWLRFDSATNELYCLMCRNRDLNDARRNSLPFVAGLSWTEIDTPQLIGKLRQHEQSDLHTSGEVNANGSSASEISPGKISAASEVFDSSDDETATTTSAPLKRRFKIVFRAASAASAKSKRAKRHDSQQRSAE